MNRAKGLISIEAALVALVLLGGIAVAIVFQQRASAREETVSVGDLSIKTRAGLISLTEEKERLQGELAELSPNPPKDGLGDSP